MRRIWMVATRDFQATIGRKGFLLGLFVMPVLIVLVIVAIPRLMNSRAPQVRGDVAVIDPTGSVLPQLRTALAPAAIAARRLQAGRLAMPPTGPGALRQGFAQPPGAAPVPLLKILTLPPDAQASQEKSWLIQTDARQQPSHLALIVIHPDSVARAPQAAGYGSYDLYVAKSLNDATESVIQDGIRQALIAARLKASGINQDAVQSALSVSQPNSILIVASGQQSPNRVISGVLPLACGMLLFIGVLTGGQILMTSTVEEKSSRVVEVLLAAVSPLELMWGKLIGQFGVGLVIVAMYIGLGAIGLAQFSLLRFIDPKLVVELLAFYCITYLVFGALMLSIGAAANQVADAQSLMGPIIMLLVLPYVLTPYIGQAPNSPFSIAISFIPPVNTFGMLARLASSTPPPQWQVWLTVFVGLCAAAAAVWFAAKVFKIGLLMHGKPPNFATLIRWARMA